MKALVLSAGRGERLRPLTDTQPKPLVEIGGRPLIHYPLLMLRHAGIREVVVNVHHFAAQVESALGRGDQLGMTITYSPEPVLLGTGGALLALRGYFSREPFLIVNCDTIMDLEVKALIAAQRARGAKAMLVVRQTATPDAYSRIEVDPEGRVRRMRLLQERTRGQFDDYPALLDATLAADLQPLIYCGAMVCEPAVLDWPCAPPPFSLMSGLLALSVARAEPVFAFPHPGFFRTVDNLQAYQALRAEFAASPPPLAYLS